jgi:hypothetical protein
VRRTTLLKGWCFVSAPERSSKEFGRRPFQCALESIGARLGASQLLPSLDQLEDEFDD